MEKLIFRFDEKKLAGPYSPEIKKVLMYKKWTKLIPDDISRIGQPLADSIRRIALPIPARVLDFLTISLAVTAADTFVLRKNADDGWCRVIHLDLPVSDVKFWLSQKELLEKTLNFLSGDIWKFTFIEESYDFKINTSPRKNFKKIPIKAHDCVCLFSGGLDSAIGAIDLLSVGKDPLLVSHGYKGDKSHQMRIKSSLDDFFGGSIGHLILNAHPVTAKSGCRDREITMRTRSLSFLAFGLLGAAAVQAFISPFGAKDSLAVEKDHSQASKRMKLYVPENGFISINPPLTRRRIGSHSTRTTHPQFLTGIQELFDRAGFSCEIENPCAFKTKGEMMQLCRRPKLLENILKETVSCSHWKRSRQQCGICLPCLIRRCSINSYGHTTFDATYSYPDISHAFMKFEVNEGKKDDIASVLEFLQLKGQKVQLLKRIRMSGRLPEKDIPKYLDLVCRQIAELEKFFRDHTDLARYLPPEEDKIDP